MFREGSTANFSDHRPAISADCRRDVTAVRRSGVQPKVVSDILGHDKVNLAMDVYDRTEVDDFVQPLSVVSTELLRNVMKTPQQQKPPLALRTRNSARESSGKAALGAVICR
jgi:hypothetical protein